jgi:hypothetical protein
MVRVFAHQDMCEGALGEQAAHDQVCGRRCLRYARATPAARVFGAHGHDNLLDAQQACRKMSAIVAGSPARRRAGANLRILSGLGLVDGGYRVLKGQLKLVVVQLFRAFAMHDLVQLSNQMLQPPVAFPQRIPFTQHGQDSGTLAFGTERSMDEAADMRR